MLKLKLQYFGHLMQRVDSLEKDSDAGRDWGQEEKGTTEDDMVGWPHRLNGHGFGWTLAWKIPWMEKPGKLQSMGLRRVGHG